MTLDLWVNMDVSLHMNTFLGHQGQMSRSQGPNTPKNILSYLSREPRVVLRRDQWRWGDY